MFYVLDENKNLVEAYSKEEVIAMLNQAVADGSLNNISADAAISKVKCCVNGVTNNVAFVTSAKYNELEAAGLIKENTAYFITDDGTLEGIDAQLKSLSNTVISMGTSYSKEIADIKSGNTAVGTAKNIVGTVIFDAAQSGNLAVYDSFRGNLENGYKYIVVSGTVNTGDEHATEVIAVGKTLQFTKYLLVDVDNQETQICVIGLSENNGYVSYSYCNHVMKQGSSPYMYNKLTTTYIKKIIKLYKVF